MHTKLNTSFYCDDNVVQVAKSLLGKVLVTNINNTLTSGKIVETEAYSWIEQGCHAYKLKRTARNEPMFDQGGVSYVYLCYGVHDLFNVVTNQSGIAEAVLIRALEPMDGIQTMLKRCNAISPNKITSGPGKLTRALGISRKHNRIELLGETIWIEDKNISVRPSDIEASIRIGLSFKGKDAALPWRFTIRGNKWVSR